eukprot:scaffold35161_cov64-Phaeocystis_antarctica.AAC.7
MTVPSCSSTLYTTLGAQPQEAAAEAEAHGARALGLELQRRVVEAQPLDTLAQQLVLRAVHGEEAAVDHRDRLRVARQRLGALRRPAAADRVSHARVRHLLDGAVHVADLARTQLRRRSLLARGERADLDDLILHATRREVHGIALAHHTVDDTHEDDDAAEGVVVRVKDQSAQRAGGAVGRRWHLGDDGLEDGGHTGA